MKMMMTPENPAVPCYPDQLRRRIECQRHNADLTLRYLHRYLKRLSPERIMALHRHYEQLRDSLAGMEEELRTSGGG